MAIPSSKAINAGPSYEVNQDIIIPSRNLEFSNSPIKRKYRSGGKTFTSPRVRKK